MTEKTLADLLNEGFNVAGKYSNGDFIELERPHKKVIIYIPYNIIIENPNEKIRELIKDGKTKKRVREGKLVFIGEEETYSYDPETKVTAKLEIPNAIKSEKTIGYED